MDKYTTIWINTTWSNTECSRINALTLSAEVYDTAGMGYKSL